MSRMRVLIAEDDPVSRAMLEHVLMGWDYDVTTAQDGEEAWSVLNGENPPSLVILDWVMPGVYGDELCRRARLNPKTAGLYIIMVTQRTGEESIVQGLASGADDYVTKPYKINELRERIHVGERVLNLQAELNRRVRELEEALGKITRLEGIIPICAYCKKIRDDKDYWQQVEKYLQEHSAAVFSHSVCPDCYEKHVKPEIENLEKVMRKRS
jgi:CheY-like chemotaxis protein